MELGTATIGDNNPPDNLTILNERLAEDHADLIKRFVELTEAQKRVPECNSDEAAKKIGDYIKALSGCMKDADGRRVKEKEPFLEGGRRVDGFFKDVKDGLSKIKTETNRLLTNYQKVQEAAERRRLAEKADADRKAAEEAAEKAQAALDSMSSETDMSDAIDQEEAAREAANEAATAEKAADVSAAQISRTRSSAGGSVSSLRVTWEFENLDRETLDLEALRPYLPVNGLEQAVRGFIKAGGRELRGARIYEDKKAIVR